MLGVFAQFERAIIQERIRAGLAGVKSQGKKLGRPRTTTPEVEAAVLKAHVQGLGIRKIAREFGIGHSAVSRIIGR